VTNETAKVVPAVCGRGGEILAENGDGRLGDVLPPVGGGRGRGGILIWVWRGWRGRYCGCREGGWGGGYKRGGSGVEL